MKPSRWILLLSVVLFSVGCSGPQGPEPVSSAKEAAEGSGEVKPAESLTAPVTDISGEILGTLVLSSWDVLLKTGASYVLPHLPAAFQSMIQPQVLTAQVFKMLQVEELEPALDTGRPVALALADPSTYRDEPLGPVLIAVPVKDVDALESFLGKKSRKHESNAWKDHIFTSDEGPVHMRYVDGWALFAGTEKLLNGAPGVLLPLVKTPPTTSARVRVNMAEIYKRYGDKIEKVRAMIGKPLGQGAELNPFATMGPSAERWITFAKNIQSFDMTFDMLPQKILFSLSAKAGGPGPFSTYLGKLNVGPAWGAGFMPADSVFVGTGRYEKSIMKEDLMSSYRMLQTFLKGYIELKMLERWREAFGRYLHHLSGESSVAMWINADGGLGLGWASRLTDSKMAGRVMHDIMTMLSKDLKQLIPKALPKFIRDELPGLGLRLKVRPGALRVGGIKGDLYELVIKWPRLKDKAQRKELAQVRKKIAKVIGRRFVVATAIVGDVGFMTMGKDHRQRLATMVALAKSGKHTSIKGTLDQITGAKKSVFSLYSPLASLTEGSLRVVDQVATVPPMVKDVMHKAMPGPGKDVPLSMLMFVEGDRLILDSSVSAELVGMITRGVLQAVMMKSGMGRTP